jgi:hypothetical protein
MKMKKATWFEYLEVMEKSGNCAAWAFAKKHFPKTSSQYSSAKQIYKPTAAQRRETLARQRAINSVTSSEINAHFMLGGLPKIGA